MIWKKRNRRLERQIGVSRCLVAGFIFLAVVGVIYFSLNSKSALLAGELRRLEDERSKLGKQHLNEEYRWARMKSPQSLEKALTDRRLVMGAPRHDQVVRLRVAPKSDRALLAVAGGRRPPNGGDAVHE
jgi:hypothetical protein